MDPDMVLPTYITLVGGAAAGLYGLMKLQERLATDTDKDPVQFIGPDSGFEAVRKPARRYGLIVVGDGGDPYIDSRDANSSLHANQVLLRRGFASQDMFIIAGDRRAARRYQGNALSSSSGHFREVMEYLAKTMTPDDMLFTYVISHGSKEGLLSIFNQGDSQFHLAKGSVGEDELQERMERIPADHKVSFFESCFSGGLAERVGQGRSVGISTSTPDKITLVENDRRWIRRFGPYSSAFSLGFFSAMDGEFPQGGKARPRDRTLEGLARYASDFQKDAPTSVYNTPHVYFDKVHPAHIRL